MAVIRVADLPKLYAHWAETALDSRDGGALHRAGDVLRRAEHAGDDRDWLDLPASIREFYLQDAADVVAAALGFKVTPDGLAALGLEDRT